MSTEPEQKYASAAAIRAMLRGMAPEALLTAEQIKAIVGPTKKGSIHQMLHRLASIGMLTRDQSSRPIRYGLGRTPSWEQDVDEQRARIREANRISNLRYRSRKRQEAGLDPLPPPPPPPPPIARVVTVMERTTATHTSAPKAAPAAPAAPVKPETIEQWQARTGQRPEQLAGPGAAPVAYGRRPSSPAY